MHKLNDQWIEIIDGVEHMVKAVEGVLCKGCMFSSMCLFGIDRNFNLHRCEFDGDCPVGGGDRYNLQNPDIIIKDLGILRDGVLSCPFCKEYPSLIKPENGYQRLERPSRNGYAYECGCGVICGWDYDYGGMYQTEQEALDAWNRRS